METQELLELTERVRDHRQKQIGLTMAVIAAFLAAATLMGHRLHTEEVVTQTKLADRWAFFQAKNGRAHLYATDADLAALLGPNGATLAARWRLKADEEKAQAEEVRRENDRLTGEAARAAARANYFDVAELAFEVAIVLCSVALLTDAARFWRISFIATLAGLIFGALGFVAM